MSSSQKRKTGDDPDKSLTNSGKTGDAGSVGNSGSIGDVDSTDSTGNSNIAGKSKRSDKSGNTRDDDACSHAVEADEQMIEAVRELLNSMPERDAFADGVLAVVDKSSENRKSRDYIEAIARVPVLDPENEQRLLLDLSKDGVGRKTARSKLKEAYLPLVVWIAKDYCEAEVSFTDLVSEGAVGLLKAVETYEPVEGFSFAESTAIAIKEAISAAVAEETLSKRVPNYILEKINSLKDVTRQLTQEKGQEPTRAEIAEAIGFSSEELERLVGLAKVKEEPEPEADFQADLDDDEIDPQLDYD
ncbi:MAG: hypothetical protein K8F91_10365 [Candidatus Obscuribacterales bacterium]|nr:hypothetical protein [Candidatus Obscuribacterales bacterium]